MKALDRPFVDPFWPLFLVCFVIGIWELMAVLFAYQGNLATAEQYERWWFWGCAFSFWLWNSGISNKPTTRLAILLNKSPLQSSWRERIILLAMFCTCVVLLWAFQYLESRGAIMVRGSIVSVYLLVSCYCAWYRRPAYRLAR